MGCFSFLCKVSEKPALSTSFDGSPCHLFLLKDGKVLEHMFGNYDSYGRVFKKGKKDSFEWSMDWGDVCTLMFNPNEGDGIAMILHDYYIDEYPTTQSERDPNQGWGEELELMSETDDDTFMEVKEPFHKVFQENVLEEEEPDQTIVIINGVASNIENIKKINILANGESVYRITIVGDKLEITSPVKISTTTESKTNTVTLQAK